MNVPGHPGRVLVRRPTILGYHRLVRLAANVDGGKGEVRDQGHVVRQVSGPRRGLVWPDIRPSNRVVRAHIRRYYIQRRASNIGSNSLVSNRSSAVWLHRRSPVSVTRTAHNPDGGCGPQGGEELASVCQI